jgi:hypothetical protein
VLCGSSHFDSVVSSAGVDAHAGWWLESFGLCFPVCASTCVLGCWLLISTVLVPLRLLTHTVGVAVSGRVEWLGHVPRCVSTRVVGEMLGIGAVWLGHMPRYVLTHTVGEMLGIGTVWLVPSRTRSDVPVDAHVTTRLSWYVETAQNDDSTAQCAC